MRYRIQVLARDGSALENYYYNYGFARGVFSHIKQHKDTCVCRFYKKTWGVGRVEVD